MAARLGRVIYWLATTVAVLLLALALVAALFWIKPEIQGSAQGYWLCVMIGGAGVAVWLLGRAVRYILANE